MGEMSRIEGVIMRFVGYIVLVLIGVIIGTYWPAASYLPPKATVMETIGDNAPFLAEWLPEADEAEPEDDAEPASSDSSDPGE